MPVRHRRPFVTVSPVSYEGLNAMEKRILMRRPLNPYAALCLKKPRLRLFLNINGQRCKDRDRKERLIQLILAYITRRDTMIYFGEMVATSNPETSSDPSAGNTTEASDPLTLAQDEVSTNNPVHTENDFNIPVDDTPIVIPVSNCNNSLNCNCDFTINGIFYDRVISIPLSEREMVAEFITKSNDEMKEILINQFQINPMYNCKILLTKQLRDKLESIQENKRLSENMIPVSREGSYVPAMCMKCNLRSARALHIPCGHVFYCVECAEGLKECPDSECDKKEVQKIIRMYLNDEK